MADHIVYAREDSGSFIAGADYLELLPGKPVKIGTPAQVEDPADPAKVTAAFAKQLVADGQAFYCNEKGQEKSTTQGKVTPPEKPVLVTLVAEPTVPTGEAEEARVATPEVMNIGAPAEK